MTTVIASTNSTNLVKYINAMNIRRKEDDKESASFGP